MYTMNQHLANLEKGAVENGVVDCFINKSPLIWYIDLIIETILTNYWNKFNKNMKKYGLKLFY